MRLAFHLLGALLVLSLCSLVAAGEAAPTVNHPVELLWPDGAPNARGNAEADKPSLMLYPLPKPEQLVPAVIVCPGGGYAGLAFDYEGTEAAEWLNANGVAAFVLRYRVNPYRHPCPLLDAQRAIRMVRARAAEWGVDPARIGILGFSAGGHLASTAGTHVDVGKPSAADPIERVSSRPDFMVLVYPVITMTGPFAHAGSRRNLLGAHPNPTLAEKVSSDMRVTPETPPAFLVHSTEDSVVPAENSVMFYLALRKAKIRSELHIYEHGEHGYGLGKKDPVLGTWPKLCLDWLRGIGFLDKP